MESVESFAQHLCMGDRENLKWVGTFEDLKEFVDCFVCEVEFDWQWL